MQAAGLLVAFAQVIFGHALPLRRATGPFPQPCADCQKNRPRITLATRRSSPRQCQWVGFQLHRTCAIRRALKNPHYVSRSELYPDHPARSFHRSAEKSTFCNAHHATIPTQVMRLDGGALAPLLRSAAGLPKTLTVSGCAKPLTIATGTPACHSASNRRARQ